MPMSFVHGHALRPVAAGTQTPHGIMYSSCYMVAYSGLHIGAARCLLVLEQVHACHLMGAASARVHMQVHACKHSADE